MASPTEERLKKQLQEAQAKLQKQQKAAKKAKREWKPSFDGQHRGY
jgi:hypothetical protein